MICTARSKKYVLLFLLLSGGVLLWMFFFTCENGFTKPAFSRDHNYVYEMDRSIFAAAEPEDEQLILAIPLFLYKADGKVNYINVIAHDIGDDSVRINVVGAYCTEEYKTVFSADKVQLHDGNNYIEIPSKRINLITLVVKGTNKKVIENVEFRESIKPETTKRAVLLTLCIGILYSLIVTLIMKKI